MPRAKRRRADPRRIKLHRTYTVDEIARTLDLHKNTVRYWIRGGLATIDHACPALVHGAALREFLSARRTNAKRPCRPGQLYCVRCRTPKVPAGKMADYLPSAGGAGILRAICPDCETLMHRRVALAALAQIQTDLDVAFPEDDPRIRERDHPSVNSDSREEG